MSTTKTLARYITAASYEDLPISVVEAAKKILLDSLACALAGYHTEAGRIYLEYAREQGGKPESVIVGDRLKVPCTRAAFVNTNVGNVLDFEETYRIDQGHPGPVAVFAALAAGDRVGASGRELINSIVIGYEVATRIWDAMEPTDLSKRLKENRVTPWGTWETFASAAAAARIMKLDDEQTLHTLNLTAQTAKIPAAPKGLEIPMPASRNAYGWSAERGVESAILAQRGLTGPPDMLDGDGGFWACIGSDRWEEEAVTKGLGESYNILNHSIKLHSCCRYLHSTLEALSGAIADLSLSPSDIISVNVRTNSVLCKPPFTLHDPRFGRALNSFSTAQKSIPWIVSMMLLGYEPGADWYSEARFRDQTVLELIKRVSVQPDEEADRAFLEDPTHCLSKVEVLTNGGSLAGKSDYARGDPQMPVGREELTTKFIKLARKSLGEARTVEIIKAVDRSETIDVRELTALLQPSPLS